MVSKLDLEQWSATQAEFGELVGMSQQNVSALTARGVLSPGESFAVWLLAYCGNLRDVAAGRDADSPLTTERARLASAQAERVEMANLVARRRLAPVDLLEEVLANVCRQIVTIFDAIPSQLRTRCPDLPGDAMRIVEDEIARARSIAADVTLNDLDQTQTDPGDDVGPEPASSDAKLGASLGAS